MHLLRRALSVCILCLIAGCAATNGPGPEWINLKSGPGLDGVLGNIDAFIGREVLWGGRIVRSVNREEGTLLEVLEQPLGSRGRPESGDRSAGRFLFLYPGYLETLIYSQGREVTVSGRLIGSRTLDLQEIEYTYPLITSEDIHLWEAEPEVIRFEHTYPYGRPSTYPSPWYWRWDYW